jgi:hypothetical protein
MDWNRSNAIGLASTTCNCCQGQGMRTVHKVREAPCNCVFRAIFRACFNRFRECTELGAHTSTVSLEFCDGHDGRRAYARKREEYIADFSLVSRRMLEDEDHQIFRYFFLLGADWKLCCHRLKLDRGNFFHSVYRIEQKLGRGFAELEPYALYPLDEYFGGVIKKEACHSSLADPLQSHTERRIPLPLSA